ncbi:MAG: toprim domain-containing protein, partial [Planctomycetota bacterium]
MTRPNIVTRLGEAGVLRQALADLLNLEAPPEPGTAIRCVYPERHKNGDAHPSLVIAKDGARATCRACGFGGGLLDIAMDRWNLPSHAGAAAELERRYLAPPPGPGKPQIYKPHTDAYDYVDEYGRLLFQVLRFKTSEPDGRTGKTFRQRRPDPNGSRNWIPQLGDARRVLFRLPSVRKAVNSGQTIFIAEGEKDVLALESAGVVATCNPGGANKWRPEYTESLREAAMVVVVADKDVPGWRHARKVADALHLVVETVRIVEPKEGKDSSDHLAAGHTVDDFVEQDSDALAATDDRWDGPIEIDITPDVGEIVDRTDEALRRSPTEMYQRAGSIVRVQRERTPKHLLRPPAAPHVVLLPADALFEALALVANWYGETNAGRKRVHPPKWAVNVLLARGHWTFPWLEGIIETPTIRRDGSIVDQPGYDDRTGLLYEPRRDFPPVPSDPGEAEIQEALRELLEPFAEFPWLTSADEAAAIASL